MKSFMAAWAKVNSGAEGGPGEGNKNQLFLNLGVARKGTENIARIQTICFVGRSRAVTNGGHAIDMIENSPLGTSRQIKHRGI